MAIWNLVLSGYPGCGKTTLAKRIIADYPRFVRLSSDDLRAMFFNEPFPARDEEIIYPALGTLRDLMLKSNYSVVLDTTAPNNESRNFLLNTKVKDVNNLMIVFNVDKKILVERNRRVKHDDAVAVWDRYWEMPSGRIPMLKFRNNTKAEMEIHYSILKEVLASKIFPFEQHFFSRIFPVKKIFGK